MALPTQRQTAAHNLAPAEAGLVPPIVPPTPAVLSRHTVEMECTAHTAGPGTLDAEWRQLTVVVCHVTGLVELAGQRGPEALVEVVRDYHAMCAEVVRRFAGHIAQSQVDGLVVYFGWPQTREDDARRAVQTGLDIVEGMRRFTQCCTLDWGVELAVQVGIHTGLVVMNALGQSAPCKPLALGTTPIIATRVQGLAAPDTVVISSTTLCLVQGYFICQPLGTHGLDDLSPSLTVHQVLSASPTQSRFDITITRGLTPLVGRAPEIDLLRERWAQAQDGRGQVVLLSGEPGIGKSRLAQVLKEFLVGDVHTRIECHCLPDYQQSALYPVIEHLRRLLQWHRAETHRRSHCRQRWKQRWRPLGCRWGKSSHCWPPCCHCRYRRAMPRRPWSPRSRSRRPCKRCWPGCSRRRSSSPSASSWKTCTGRIPPRWNGLACSSSQIPTARVLLLLLFRPEFHPPWAVHSYLTHLALGRLSPSQTAGMIAQVVGGKALPAEVVQQVVATTDGVPLFVEELIKMILESGLLKEREGRYALTGPLPSGAIPATLHDSLMARLDRLGPARQVAQLGAVVGREFSYEMLQAVSSVDETLLQQALAQLVEAELLYQRGLPPQARYVFTHALIQDAAYQSLRRSTPAAVPPADCPNISGALSRDGGGAPRAVGASLYRGMPL